MKKLILTTIVAAALSGCAGLKQASKQNYDDTYYAINEKRPDVVVYAQASKTERNENKVSTQKRTASSQYNGRYSSRFNRMGYTCNQGFYGQPNYNMYGYGNPYNSFYNPYNNFGLGLGWQMTPHLSMGWGMNPYSNFGYYNSPGYYYGMGYQHGYNNGNYYNNNNSSGSSKPKGLYMRRNTPNTNLPANNSGGTIYRPGSSSIQNNSTGTTRTSINSSNGTSSSPSNSGNNSGNTSSTRGGTISSGNSNSGSSSSGSIFSGSSTRGSGSSGTSGGSIGGGSRGGSGSSGGSSGKRR